MHSSSNEFIINQWTICIYINLRFSCLSIILMNFFFIQIVQTFSHPETHTHTSPTPLHNHLVSGVNFYTSINNNDISLLISNHHALTKQNSLILVHRSPSQKKIGFRSRAYMPQYWTIYLSQCMVFPYEL